VTLSEARPADIDVLAGYMRQLRADDPMPTERDVGFDASVAAMKQLIEDGSLGRVWLIRHDDAPAGYVALTFAYSIEFGGRTAFIDEFFVDASHRWHGVGKAALRLVTDQAMLLGVRVLFLEATPTNAAADRLYRGAGFVERDYKLMWKAART
jgi:GNAT superfamily N-acetyltransferase